MSDAWPIRPLGELCEIELGRTPSRANLSYWDEKRRTSNVWLSIADLLDAVGDVVTDSAEYVSDEGAKLCKLVKKGTLLVSFKLTLGRLAYAGRDLFTNEAIAALTLKDRSLSKEYLFWYLQHFDWQKAAEGDEKVKGKTLNKAKLQVLPVIVPPLPEQRRIVAILDEAFAAIATAKANTEQNLANARAVFDSEREAVLSNSASSWTPTTVGDEVDLLSGFPFKSNGYTEHEKDVRLLRGDNIIQGRLRWDDVMRWPARDTAAYTRYQLANGDVVLAMDRPWVKAGLKCAQIGVDDLPCLLVQRTSRLRSGAALDQNYLKYLLGSVAFSRHLLGVQTGIGVPHISGQQIKDFRFSRPPLAEQRRLVGRLNHLDTETQRLESIARQKLAALNSLKASLLHHAFTGQLTEKPEGAVYA